MVEYRGYDVYKCGTWTQGPYLCQTLQILEGFDLRKMGHLSADYVHVLVEALILGLADRDYYYGDPRFVNVPIKRLLSQPYGDLRRGLINMRKASLEVRPGNPVVMKALADDPGKYRPGPGGTTTCVVADKWGNFVLRHPEWKSSLSHLRSPRGSSRQSTSQSQYYIRASESDRGGYTSPDHPNADPGAQGWVPCNGYQRGWRRLAGPDYLQLSAECARIWNESERSRILCTFQHAALRELFRSEPEARDFWAGAGDPAGYHPGGGRKEPFRSRTPD